MTLKGEGAGVAIAKQITLIKVSRLTILNSVVWLGRVTKCLNYRCDLDVEVDGPMIDGLGSIIDIKY